MSKPTPPPMWLIAFTISSSIVGMTLIAPALPLIRVSLGASSDAVQLLLSLYLAALAIGQLVYGSISDAIGRRPILIFGTIMYCLSGAAGAFATNIEWLTLSRVIQGLGAAACLAMGRAIVNDCFDRSNAARNMSTIQMLQAIIPGASLALGGVTADALGWQGTMGIMSITGGLAFVLCLVMVRETNMDKTRKLQLSTIISGYQAVLKNRIFILFSTTAAMQVGMFISMNGFLPYQFQRLGFSATEFGLWFSLTPLSYLVGNTLNKYYFISKGIEKTTLLGCALCLLAVIALFLGQYLGMTHVLYLVFPCCLFGFSNGIIIANSTVSAIAAAGRHSGTGTGIVGAWQMALSGIAGSLIIAFGGDLNFFVGTNVMFIMSISALASMIWVYQSSRTPSS